MTAIELAGDNFVVVNEDHQEHMNFVADNLEAIIMGPGSGEQCLSNLNSIDEMLKCLPNLKYVGVIISWFINDLNASVAKISPGVEKESGELHSEDRWEVGKYKRESAHKIHRDNSSDPSTVRYGGTPSDEDVVKFFDYLKSKNIKTAFYPFLMVDNAEKSWRGFIDGRDDKLNNFYENQYKPFITHYAELLKNKVDTFYLGSELKALVCHKNSDNSFPFVGSLVNLASVTRKELGPEVKISYAANWNSFHSCHSGLRPLDEFWGNENVNFVGINYYMPLTSDNENPTVEDIKDGFIFGEGADFYLDGIEEKPFNDESAQWKNIEFWHNNEHWEWDNEAQESKKTKWVPESKPVIFSEFGFRSLSGATNEPHLHGDDMPKDSTGKVDYPLQMRAIRATIEHIDENTFLENGFYYLWDTRGFGWQDLYADGDKWEKGHWIDGKVVKRG